MLNIQIFTFNPFSENTYVLYNENKNGVIIDPGNWNEKETEALENFIKEKIEADAPIATYKGEPVTKGTGRFGPFVKYKDLYVNVPKKYDFDNLTQGDIEELISAKLEKEANRYIQQWEKEKISIENGRWGPFIKFGKAMFKIPKKEDGSKYEACFHLLFSEF